MCFRYAQGRGGPKFITDKKKEVMENIYESGYWLETYMTHDVLDITQESEGKEADNK